MTDTYAHRYIDININIIYYLMGYKYSIWLIPNNWKYIQSYYKTEHIPHVTIKTLLSQKDAFKEYIEFLADS